MKTQYEVKRIKLKPNMNVNDYWDAVKRAPIHYCAGLEELRQYCGGKLHRGRCGYSGINGDIEYVAIRCK